MSRSILLKIRKRISRLRLKYVYWVVEESSGNRSFSVVGNPGGMNPYRRLYLSDGELTTFKSKLYRGGSGISAPLAASSGLAVISELDMSPELEAQTVRVPNFVALSLDLPMTPEAYWASLGHSARDDVRRIKKNGFTSVVSADPSWSGVFCERYHHPSISTRHGNEGIRMPASEMKMVLETGNAGFLKIYLGNDCVAAVVYQVIAGCFYFLRLGWLDGRDELLKNGVVAATYWFSIHLAYTLGCSKVNFGGTPSYLENGVLRFKLKWRATLSMEYTKRSSCYLLLNPEHPDCYQFMKSYSFIIWSKETTFFVISGSYPDKQLAVTRLLEGIAGWFVLLPARNDEVVTEDTKVLPEHLRRWYRKVSINIEKDDVSEMKYATGL